MYQPTDITFTDPREFDGDPYDVAERAVAQIEGIIKVYDIAVTTGMIVSRNAYMERNLALRKPPAGDQYFDTAEGRKFIRLQQSINDARDALKGLKAAVSYNPKHPPRA